MSSSGVSLAHLALIQSWTSHDLSFSQSFISVSDVKLSFLTSSSAIYTDYTYSFIHIGDIKLTSSWGIIRFEFELSFFPCLMSNLCNRPDFFGWTSILLFLKWGYNHFSWDGSENYIKQCTSALMISSTCLLLHGVYRDFPSWTIRIVLLVLLVIVVLVILLVLLVILNSGDSKRVVCSLAAEITCKLYQFNLELMKYLTIF